MAKPTESTQGRPIKSRPVTTRGSVMSIATSLQQTMRCTNIVSNADQHGDTMIMLILMFVVANLLQALMFVYLVKTISLRNADLHVVDQAQRS